MADRPWWDEDPELHAQAEELRAKAEAEGIRSGKPNPAAAAPADVFVRKNRSWPF